MNAHANKGFASRVGYGLGTFVRYFLYDARPVLAWVKRAAFFSVIALFLSFSFSWLASALMSVLLVVMLLFLIVHGGSLDEEDPIRRINENAESEFGGLPRRGDYDHPDYYDYHKD
ncbi:hypothetical protein [Pseudomonas aeruginosa]|uniref:hypothetical protein n=1 Tax=Pseudomonas aeruginosa TaxID=287 RepID=UPI000FFCC056|nr:hypothetical protein [Pseudomonas aeruginosa]QGQ05861.1 hypothetical protein FDK04_25865 [Pseudomonas aeruginosa]UEG04200.1 hypothetical protein LLH04_22535 [Pseudomonas aeruginosa]